jgi:hypothetical protein
MKGSWLRYFGFLGLLGLLALVTPNAGFAGFFGFFGFFGFAKYGDDERLQINIGLAARNAFVVSVVAYALITVCGALFFGATMTVYAIGFAVIVVLQLLVFSLSLAYYER